jgi:chromosome segregation ATPase
MSEQPPHTSPRDAARAQEVALNELGERIYASYREIARLEADLRLHEIAVKSFKSQVDEHEATIALLRADLATYRKETQMREETLRVLHAAIASVRAELGDFTSDAA